jgi:ubiquinone/menaquinone biosynthesis C-methylase UbiE
LIFTEYVCPDTKTDLVLSDDKLELRAKSGKIYPIQKISDVDVAPNFMPHDPQSGALNSNLEIYDQKFSVERYQNELEWLYETFGVVETAFRKEIIKPLNLRPGDKVLITACGLGSDVPRILDAIGPEGCLYIQDLASEMVSASAKSTRAKGYTGANIYFSISDAQNLPFKAEYFDAVFHFGGINLFDDLKASISEMSRVTKNGGRVVFGDESVAPWLRASDYGKAAIKNNSLWGVVTPINLLPQNAVDVNLSWVFGNCFYLISFSVSEKGPYMNMDVVHKSPRGGSMRTRYFGQLEGVNPKTVLLIQAEAKKRQISVHELLENMINNQIRD